MSWTASLSLTEADARTLTPALELDEAFAALPVDVLEIGPDQWRLALYFTEEPTKAERAALDALVRRVLGDQTLPFAFDALPDDDWVSKSLEGLRPIRVGRFVVHGAHDRAACRANDLGIEIEAGEAFGTGHHGTTAGCLAAIDRLARIRRIGQALDIGTGSAVLAIAIARRFHCPVLASDIDPVAVRVARENVRLNGVGPWVTTVCAAGVDGALFNGRGRFDLVVANILAGPLVAMAPEIRRRVAAGGTLVLSGLLAHQTNRVAAAYRAQGLRLQRAEQRDEWMTLTFGG